MTKLLRFTPAARADLIGIWDYTARHWDMDQADLYLEELHGICLALALERWPAARLICAPEPERRGLARNRGRDLHAGAGCARVWHGRWQP